MRRPNVVNAIIIGLLVPRLAVGQSTPAVPDFQLELKADFAPEISRNTAGVEGVWFNTIDAQYLLYMRATMVPGLLKLDARNAQVVDQLNAQLKLYDRMSSLQDGQVVVVKDALKDTQKELEKCREAQSLKEMVLRIGVK